MTRTQLWMPGCGHLRQAPSLQDRRWNACLFLLHQLYAWPAHRLTTKTLRPIGGAVSPMPTTISTRMPNQIADVVGRHAEIERLDDREEHRQRQQDHGQLVHDRAEQDVEDEQHRDDGIGRQARAR